MMRINTDLPPGEGLEILGPPSLTLLTVLNAHI